MNFFRNLWASAKRNAPTILTVSGITLFLTSTGLAIKATPKAMKAIEERKEEEGHEQLTFVQTVQTVWKYYIWALTAAIGGTVCEISALNEGNKRIATLMAAAETGTNIYREFQDYRRFVAERIGQKKEAEIHNQAVQETVNRNPPPPEMRHDFVEGQVPKPICCYEGRYMYLAYEDVREAVNKMNYEINNGLNGYVSMNDLFEELRMKTTTEGDMLGWSIETGLIEIPEKDEICYAGTPNGWPCWVLEFKNPPQYEYQYFRKH